MRRAREVMTIGCTCNVSLQCNRDLGDRNRIVGLQLTYRHCSARFAPALRANCSSIQFKIHKRIVDARAFTKSIAYKLSRDFSFSSFPGA